MTNSISLIYIITIYYYRNRIGQKYYRYAKEFIEWYSKWNGEKILISDIKNICNLNTKQWEKLKKHKDIEIYFNNIKIIRDNKKYYLIKK